MRNILPAPASRTTGRLDQLRARGSRALRAVFAPTPSPVVPPRPWRPPVSGHTTSRYADLAVHPFVTVATDPEPEDLAATAPVEIASEQADTRPGEVQDEMRGPTRTPVTVQKSSSLQQTRTTSPSQRSLRAVSENAIPVTPERVRLRTEQSQAARSVSLPKAKQFMAAQSHGSVTASIDGNLTTRTAQLLEQFPTPPNVEHAIRVKHPMLKRRALSLSLSPKIRTIAAPEINLGRANSFAADPPLSSGTLTDRPVRNTPSSDDQGAHRALQRQDYNISAVFPLHALDTISRPNTSTSRYFTASSTALGTRAVSQAERRGDKQLQRAITNGAGRFGACRAVSERRTSIPASAAEDQNEHDFPLTLVTVTRADKEYCQHKLAKLQEQETTPIALTAMSTGQVQLDGTSSLPLATFVAQNTSVAGGPPPAQAATPSSYLGLSTQPRPNEQVTQQQEPAVTTTDFAPDALPTSTNPPLASRQPQRDSIISFASSSRHIKNRRAHTWRTRIKRTKCWKCELEARRRDTATFFRRNTGDLKRGVTDLLTSIDWFEKKSMNLTHCLRWTCFCRYRAYDDDLAEEEEAARFADVRRQANVQDRARLGSSGDNLPGGEARV